MLGETKVNLEDVRQTEFYKQPWVKEAVFHYLTSKVNIEPSHIHKLIMIRHNKKCKSYWLHSLLQNNLNKHLLVVRFY